MFNNNSKKEERDFVLRKARKSESELSSVYTELSSDSDFRSDFPEELRAFLEKLPKLVEIVCFCLNPNHYHFVLKQLAEDGISKFMHKLDLGYTNYFNKKYDRSGSLFQGTFKEAHIKTNEYLLYLSGYANGNVEIHKIAKAEDWQWSSYRDYLGLRNGTLCNKEIILSQFKSVEEYKEYVDLVIKNSSERKEEMKEYILE